jgi:hypothetical protein
MILTIDHMFDHCILDRPNVTLGSSMAAILLRNDDVRYKGHMNTDPGWPAASTEQYMYPAIRATLSLLARGRFPGRMGFILLVIDTVPVNHSL